MKFLCFLSSYAILFLMVLQIAASAPQGNLQDEIHLLTNIFRRHNPENEHMQPADKEDEIPTSKDDDLAEKEMVVAQMEDEPQIMESPTVEKGVSKDFLRFDHQKHLHNIVPNDLYQADARKCANWADGCDFASLKDKFLSHHEVPMVDLFHIWDK